MQNHAKCSRKGLNFGMWVSFHLRNIALKFFQLGLHKQDKVSHYMSDRAHKVKADIEKNFGGKCWP